MKVQYGEILKNHSAFVSFLIASLTLLLIYGSLSRYIGFLVIYMTIIYGIFLVCKKAKKILIAVHVSAIVIFYCFISFSSFYPVFMKPVKTVSSYYTGWNYYNLQAFSFYKGKVSLPDVPSEKLRALDNPYDPEERRIKQISYEKYDYILDFSYYKDKYYLYFGIVPVLTVYLPFLAVTKYFLSDAVVVLLFSVLSFFAAFCIFMKVKRKIAGGADFFSFALCVIALGLSPSFLYLIEKSRIYEVAIITGIFFSLLSFLCLFKFIGQKEEKKKYIYLFFSGLFIGLAAGCRPFYAIIALIQIFVFADFKYILEQKRRFLYYIIPLSVSAVVIMGYNFIRFDSPFEFGIKYQLTIFDIYNWKISAAYILSSIKNYLFFAPVELQVFPYYSLIIPDNMKHSGDVSIGLIYIAPFLIFLLCSLKFFKSVKIAYEYKKYLGVMMLSGFFIMLFVSSMGSNYRFVADFSIYLIIPALLFFLFSLQGLKGFGKYIFQYFGMLLIVAAIVFNAAISVSNGINMIEMCNPEVLGVLKNLL